MQWGTPVVLLRQNDGSVYIKELQQLVFFNTCKQSFPFTVFLFVLGVNMCGMKA